VSQTRRSCAHALTGALQRGRRPPSRELVRQLLTGLSHPAREKDHLARRADISNDTAARLFGLLSSLFLSLSPSRCPSPGVQSGLPVPARFPSLPATRACRTRGRSSSSPRGSSKTRFGNCTRFAASFYPPCRGTFYAEGLTGVYSDFLKSPLFRRTLFIPLSCSSRDNDGSARYTRIRVYLMHHRFS